MSSHADPGVRPQPAASFELRYDWKRAAVAGIYRLPLPELVFRAQSVHRQWHAPDRVQTCQLLSIKTGGCPEDCAYCPQSAHYDTDVERQGLLDPQHVVEVAREAVDRGVTRFCMGAAWRQVPEGAEFAGDGGLLYSRHVDGAAGGTIESCGPDGL
jgi:biotin synthase